MSQKIHHDLSKVLNGVQNADEILNKLADEILNKLAEKSIIFLIEEGKMTKEKYFECVQQSATPNIQIEACSAGLITIDDVNFTNFSDDDYQKLLSKTSGQFEISTEKFQQIHKKLKLVFDKMLCTPNISFSDGKLKISIPTTEKIISSAVNSSFISENVKKFNPCYSTLLYTGAFAFTLSNALFRFNNWCGATNCDSRRKLYGILFCVGIPMTFGGVFGKNNAMIASGFSLAISASYLETFYQFRYDTTLFLHSLLHLVGYASICSGLYKGIFSSV